METKFKKMLTSTLLISILIISAMLLTVSAANDIPTRKTGAYLSVAPSTIGVNQPLTVNMWIYPAPATRTFNWWHMGFTDMKITFTRPDGSTDSFLPVDGSGGLSAGESEMIGAIWFFYYPNQVGAWKAQFSYLGNTFGSGNDSVFYEAATSQVTSFTVQKDPVNAGIINGYPPASLPTGYWERPINSENREWWQISGGWYGTNIEGNFNPYATAPNAPHVLWTRKTNEEGLVGGAWGSLSFEDRTPSRDAIIMLGRVYCNMPGGVFQCVDLRTGQLLYTATGAPTQGQMLRQTTRDLTRGTPETAGAAVIPQLWELGSSSWKRFNPLTGALLETITNVPGAMTTDWSDGNPIVYCLRQPDWNTTIPFRRAQNELIKWNYSAVPSGGKWSAGIVWNISLKQPDGTGPGEGNRGSAIFAYDNIVVVGTTGEDMFYAYNEATGAKLWTKQIPFEQMSAIWWAAGTLILWDSSVMVLHAYDLKTFNELWTCQVGKYPWGSQFSNRGVAYGNLYTGAYDGYMRCIDLTTGKLKWEIYLGDSGETAWGTRATYAGGGIADGKIYVATSEHSPSQPRPRDQLTFCLDAYTGQQIWNISGVIGSGYGGNRAIAEGYYIGVNEYDGLMYCLGRGKTETTVTVSMSPITKGASSVIQGTVLDQSPGQPNTPAVADACMSEWMEYVHMQKAMPTNVQGVPVILTATAPDGSNINIGTATSDGYGAFFYSWTPPETGIYKVQATFAGTNSYWSSTAETALSVTTAPTTPSASPTESVKQAEVVDYSTMIYALMTGVAIAILIGVANLWVIRKQK